MKKHLVISLAAFAIGLPSIAVAQSEAAKQLQQYREMLAEGNPAELHELRGEELWKKPGGPKKASLEKCDLGLGPGVVKGAYAHLPRYFADTDKVQDLESRLVTCRSTLQGIDVKELTRRPFGSPEHKADNEALVAYIVAQSRGVKMNVSTRHPKEREFYEVGKQIFYYRAGPFDFSCATCHAEENKRIRLQDLPDLTKPAGARLAYTTWPAYRVSQGELRTFQWRLNDCYRQMRYPEPKFISDTTVALTLYLAVGANGAEFAAPAIKR